PRMALRSGTFLDPSSRQEVPVMTRSAAYVFGAAFLIAGILGFVPAATPGGMLFGLFHVNTAHNSVHLLTGVIALWTGATGLEAAKRFFQVFGVIYAAVAILGFIYGDAPIFGLIANNLGDTWLHVAVAILSLYLGFATRGLPALTHAPRAHQPH